MVNNKTKALALVKINNEIPFVILSYVKLNEISSLTTVGAWEFDWGGRLLKSNEDAQKLFQQNKNFVQNVITNESFTFKQTCLKGFKLLYISNLKYVIVTRYF